MARRAARLSADRLSAFLGQASEASDGAGRAQHREYAIILNRVKSAARRRNALHFLHHRAAPITP
jgi:hypothetical protein